MREVLRRAVIYCRSACKTEKEDTLLAQRGMCYAFAAKSGYEVAATFSEYGSGLELEREGLVELLAYCRNPMNNVSVVIAKDPTRLSRNALHLSFIVSELQKHDIVIRYVL